MKYLEKDAFPEILPVEKIVENYNLTLKIII